MSNNLSDSHVELTDVQYASMQAKSFVYSSIIIIENRENTVKIRQIVKLPTDVYIMKVLKRKIAGKNEDL